MPASTWASRIVLGVGFAGPSPILYNPLTFSGYLDFNDSAVGSGSGEKGGATGNGVALVLEVPELTKAVHGRLAADS